MTERRIQVGIGKLNSGLGSDGGNLGITLRFAAKRKLIYSPPAFILQLFDAALYYYTLSLIMFAFRRAASRALASPILSTPVRTAHSQSQSVRTYSLLILRRPQPLSSASIWQRRFASDDSTNVNGERVEPAADGEVFHEQPPPTISEESVYKSGSESHEVNKEARASEETSSFSEAIGKAATRTQQAVEESRAPEALKEATATAVGAVARAAGATPTIPTVFVGNLFFHIDAEALAKRFEQFGVVTHAKIAKDPRGLSKGFGFVEFAEPQSVENAIQDGHNKMFEGRLMSVQPSNRNRRSTPTRSPSERRPPSRTLWVGNLSYDMTDTDLNNLFRPLENVLDVRVAIDRRTGQARGFAHADFIDVESATKALQHLEQTQIAGRTLRVDYGVSFRTKNREEE